MRYRDETEKLIAKSSGINWQRRDRQIEKHRHNVKQNLKYLEQQKAAKKKQKEMIDRRIMSQPGMEKKLEQAAKYLEQSGYNPIE